MAKKKRSPARGGSTKSKAKLKPQVKTKGAAEIRLGEFRWPMERDVLHRPDRLKYVRKLVKDEGCVFCRAREIELSFETLCVKKTEHSMIICNKYPYNSGHLLVVPRVHVADFTELSPVQYQDLMGLLQEAAKALKAVYAPGGLNLGLNQGAVAGAGIPDHLHFHLIPRWGGDLNFFPLVAETKVVVESLEATFERLITYFGKPNA